MPQVAPTVAQLNSAFDQLSPVVISDVNAAIDAADIPDFEKDAAKDMIPKFVTTKLILKWATAAATGALNVPAPSGSAQRT